jgi:hypothetical protein
MPQSHRLLSWAICGAAVVAFGIAPTITSTNVATAAGGCYNGVTVLNPYGNSCTLPGPVSRVRGSAPDANAIIACRHHPGCLATYINGP